MDSYQCYGYEAAPSVPTYMTPAPAAVCPPVAYQQTTTAPSYPGQAPSYYLQTFLVPSYPSSNPCPPPLVYPVLPDDSGFQSGDSYCPPTPSSFPAIAPSLASDGDQLSDESASVIRLRSKYIDEFGKKHSTEMATLMAMAAEEGEQVKQLEENVDQAEKKVENMKEKVRRMRRTFENQELEIEREEADLGRINKKVRIREREVAMAEDDMASMVNAKKQHSRQEWQQYGRLQKELANRRRQLEDDRRYIEEAQQNLAKMAEDRQRDEQRIKSQSGCIEQLKKQNLLLDNLRLQFKQIVEE